MASEDVTELNGKRIVVVEDDYLVANDICVHLRELGATVLGPAPTPFYAMQLIGHGRQRIDAAILDVHLHGTTVFEVADLLTTQGVPIIFATAYDRKAMPGRFGKTPLLEKPLDRQRLISKVYEMTRPVTKLTARSQFSFSAATPEVPAQVFARALAASFRSY